MDTNLDDLKHIRSMMERSSKFLSLSGMSGISAGAVALFGAWVAYSMFDGDLKITGNTLYDILILAILIIIAAATVGFYFCARKAKKDGSKLWMPVTYQVLGDFMIPMITGGLFCLVLLYQGQPYLTIPSMLIFYGLALITASSRTYKDIKILGACEIILGLFSGFFVYAYSEKIIVLIQLGIIFWAIGFGILHIIYGLVMHFKYDAKPGKDS